jgi:hypothetical protein
VLLYPDMAGFLAALPRAAAATHSQLRGAFRASGSSGPGKAQKAHAARRAAFFCREVDL